MSKIKFNTTNGNAYEEECDSIEDFNRILWEINHSSPYFTINGNIYVTEKVEKIDME